MVVSEHKAIERASDGFDNPGPASQPVWHEQALAIAEAIRKHINTVRVATPDNIEGVAAYAAHLDYLRQRYGHLVTIVPADNEAAEAGKAQHRHFAEHRSRQAGLNARIAAIPVPSGVTGTSLYQAINRFAARAIEQTTKESGKIEAANAQRLKASTPDMDLSEFGYSAMERLRNYWTARPDSKLRGGRASGRPIGLTTVDNHLSTARRLVRWLDKSDGFEWEMPRHGLDALVANLKKIETVEEVASKRHGVKVFTVDQLVVMYRSATDFERLLLLLSLNAAMAQAEVSSLRWDEVESNPQTIRRVRRKSRVYGEFAVWEQTQAALGWWCRMRPPAGPLVVVSAGGTAYTRTQIANAWFRLRGQVERDAGQSIDWWLPFKFLRKTGAQMVRQVSDGEVAGVFLSHGQPVASDDLADKYSNRPFDKVAAALHAVHEQLRPMFAAATDAFSSAALGHGWRRRKQTAPDAGGTTA